jgi:hypothetical protein
MGPPPGGPGLPAVLAATRQPMLRRPVRLRTRSSLTASTPIPSLRVRGPRAQRGKVLHGASLHPHVCIPSVCVPSVVRPSVCVLGFNVQAPIGTDRQQPEQGSGSSAPEAFTQVWRTEAAVPPPSSMARKATARLTLTPSGARLAFRGLAATIPPSRARSRCSHRAHFC